MRIAIFSDIHGNAIAFDVMLADLAGSRVDRAVCLGDVAQGGPQPVECLDRLESLGCNIVMGNSDQFLLSLDSVDESAEPITERHLAVRAWSLAQLEQRHLDFMRSFRPTVKIPLPEHGSLLCFHGSPNSFDHVILPETSDDDFERMADGHWSALMTGGHVHLQWQRRHGDTVFFNPGSVGLAYDHRQLEDDVHFDPWAEYAVVTSERGRLAIEFRRVALDPQAVIESLEHSGIPYAQQDIERWRST
jgi:predicted phosphodiesterase